MIGVIGILIITAIGYFGAGVREQLHELATASSDNLQWTMSQAEVENLALLVALKGAAGRADTPLDEVRKRFNVLYGRIGTLETGRIYADLRNVPSAAESLAALREFLDHTVSFIDGEDAVLRENLPGIIADAQEARTALRNLALQGISYYSDQKDKSRVQFSRALLNIAVLSFFLFVLLCMLILALNMLNRINQARARQTALDSSRMSAIVTSSLDAIVVVSSEGRIIEFNGAAEDIFGYDGADVIGQDMSDLIIPDHHREAHDMGMKRYRADGSKHVVGKGRLRIEAKRKSGEVFPVEVSIQTAHGEEGEIFVSYIRDISKEVEAENELRMARDSAIAGETSKAQLLAVMSHEMRTPLNGLLGTMELLSQTELTERQQRYLQIMGKSGTMLLSHVNDVLDISRLESGTTEIQKTVFDLNDLIRDVLESQNASAKANMNEFLFDDTAPEFLIAGDHNKLRQVLLNLIGNSIKFTHNGDITVEAETLEQGDQFEIRVMDTGIGIAEQDIERIFEDFTTLDTTYGRKSEGTGLGLGIVRRIVRALDGQIGVESELGIGSLFWVRMPVGLPGDRSFRRPVEFQVAAPQANMPEDVAPRKLDILLVEDNEINRTIACEFLSVAGHNVATAVDGLEGIALASQRRYNVILMDISMPGIDGIEATRRIRAGNGPSRATPIVALTAHALEDDIRHFRQAGMCDVISKPVSGDILRDAVLRLSSGETMEIGQPDPVELIDINAINDLRQQLGSEKLNDIMHKFCAEMDEEIPKVDAKAWSGADSETLAKLAHKLCGSAAVMGALELNQCLRRLDQAARSGDLAAQSRQLQELENIWTQTRQVILERF